jgi:hypothetical protein
MEAVELMDAQGVCDRTRHAILDIIKEVADRIRCIFRQTT